MWKSRYEPIVFFQHIFDKSCELLQVVEKKRLIVSAFGHLKQSLNYEKRGAKAFTGSGYKTVN